jgi:hypothetical protein
MRPSASKHLTFRPFVHLDQVQSLEVFLRADLINGDDGDFARDAVNRGPLHFFENKLEPTLSAWTLRTAVPAVSPAAAKTYCAL